MRWATAALLLVNSGEAEGLLWALLRCGGAGLQWVMHTLPRLGWLLAAGAACYCDGSVLMHVGLPQASQRSALAAWLQVLPDWPLPWLRAAGESDRHSAAKVIGPDMHGIPQSGALRCQG